MDDLYKIDRENADEKGEGARLSQNMTNSETKIGPVTGKEPVRDIRQPNIIPPTEFMALGMYHFAHN